MTNTNLVELREKVDSFMARVTDAHAGELSCRRGCHECCLTEISVFPVEADAIRSAFFTLPGHTQELIRSRAEQGLHCVFLLEGECAVYPERPIICRSQGLPLLLEDGKRTVCRLNFSDRQVDGLASEHVLNLSTLNTLLSIIHRLNIDESGAPDERIRLADIAATPRR